MKKFVVFALVMTLMLTGCGHDGAPEGVSSGGDYPAAIMVDGAVYVMAYEVAGEVDESAIIGHTTGYTDAYPTEDFHTNFSRETGLPVAKVDGGVAVLYDNEWQLFTVSGDVEISDPLGITMTVENVTPVSLTLVVSQDGTELPDEPGFGAVFAVEKLEDGNWTEVPYLRDEPVAWTCISYILPIGGSTEPKTLWWEHMYGELPAGEYRLVKKIDLYGEERQDRIYYAPFTIEEAVYEKVSSLGNIGEADTSVLVNFDGTVYAQSYAVIDYAGSGENLGTVRMVTDIGNIPYWHCETNSAELRDSWVCEHTGENIILCVDGDYRLFEKVK